MFFYSFSTQTGDLLINKKLSVKVRTKHQLSRYDTRKKTSHLPIVI